MTGNFNAQDAKNALADILDAFVISENAAKLRVARENAGNDMIKVMQTVFPITTQIQMDIISKYGFPSDGDGIIRFTQMVKLLEKQDQDVARLNAELRSIVLPHMSAPDDPTIRSPAAV
jgi:hypothetical protein